MVIYQQYAVVLKSIVAKVWERSFPVSTCTKPGPLGNGFSSLRWKNLSGLQSPELKFIQHLWECEPDSVTQHSSAAEREEIWSIWAFHHVISSSCYNQSSHRPSTIRCSTRGLKHLTVLATTHDFQSWWSSHTWAGADLPLIWVFLSQTTVYEQIIRAKIQ